MLVDCPHGWENEHGDPMPCPACLTAEIERLRDARTRILRDAQCNGFIGEDEDEAISWSIRRSAEVHKLQKAVAYLRRMAVLDPDGEPYVYLLAFTWQEFERRVSG